MLNIFQDFALIEQKNKKKVYHININIHNTKELKLMDELYNEGNARY